MVITADGTKVPVGLREGDTENGRLVTDLLADLVARGLRDDRALLVVIDGAKALDTAVRGVRQIRVDPALPTPQAQEHDRLPAEEGARLG